MVLYCHGVFKQMKLGEEKYKTKWRNDKWQLYQ